MEERRKFRVNADPAEHWLVKKELVLSIMTEACWERVHWCEEVGECGRGVQSQGRWQLLERWT